MINSLTLEKNVSEDIKISPINVLLIISISIVIAHFLVMLIGITSYHPQPLAEIIVDSIILISLLFPLLYFLAFRPLISQINQKVKAQRSLIVNERKFKNLVETMNEAVVIQNNEGVITFVNNRFSEMLGFESNDLVGHKLIDFLDEENITALKNIYSEFPFDKRLSSEMSWRNIKRQELYTVVSPSAVYDENLKAAGTLLVVTDITSRKQLELDLINARDKAEEGDKLKSAFLSLISHEIRTPINVIVNFLKLIKEDFHDNLTDELKDYVNYIESGSKRLIRTIELILNMATELTKGSKPVPERIIISEELLPTVINEFFCAAESKNVKLNYFVDSEAEIFADKFMLSQILLHLVGNAVKFTTKGEIAITLYKKNDKQCVDVKDTGIGISQQFQPKMFQIFSQEENGYSRSYEGNGLGLALVKKYCQLNRIDIRVNSKKGEGSAFTLIFNQN